MGKYNIAVDSGKYETKAVLAINKYDYKKDKSIKFRTSLSETLMDISGFGISTVGFDNKKYIVGEELQNMNDPNSTKDTLTHKICIYTAIAKLLSGIENNGADVNVVIGCPLDIFTDGKKKTAYLKNMLPKDKKIEITINDKVISFTISNAMVLPEGSGVIFLNSVSYTDEMVNIIDIGGLNVNGCQYHSLVPVFTTIFTENLGGNTLNDDLREYLVSTGKERATLSDNILEYAIKKGSVKNLPDSERVIKDIKLNKAHAILKACEKKKWSFDLVPTMFIGGASLLLKNELKEVFSVNDDSFYNDPVFANVKGFLKVLRRKS